MNDQKIPTYLFVKFHFFYIHSTELRMSSNNVGVASR